MSSESLEEKCHGERNQLRGRVVLKFFDTPNIHQLLARCAHQSKVPSPHDLLSLAHMLAETVPGSTQTWGERYVMELPKRVQKRAKL
eukprot:COSAG01_NODE_46990_length_394_cov_12.518644_1_plen_86_part_01